MKAYAAKIRRVLILSANSYSGCLRMAYMQECKCEAGLE